MIYDDDREEDMFEQHEFTDEQVKTFKEAMQLTKGKSNNWFGALLAVAGATPKEMAKLAPAIDRRFRYTWIGDPHTKFMRRSGSHKRVTEEYRAVEQVYRSVPNFWDTVRGRVVKQKLGEKGMKMLGEQMNIETYPATALDASLSEYYLTKCKKITKRSYHKYPLEHKMDYRTGANLKIEDAMEYSALAGLNFYYEPPERDEEHIQWLVQLIDARPRMTGYGKRPEWGEYRKYEIDSLAHMDEAITSKVGVRRLAIDMILPYAVQNSDRETSSSAYYKKRAIEFRCVLEAFYAVCKELGIVGVQDSSIRGRDYITEAATVGVMKHVIKMGGTYRNLVRQGFKESVARQTVLDEINTAIANRQGYLQLRFYPRNDYPDTPEEERENKRVDKKKQKVSKAKDPAKEVLAIEDGNFDELVAIAITGENNG